MIELIMLVAAVLVAAGFFGAWRGKAEELRAAWCRADQLTVHRDAALERADKREKEAAEWRRRVLIAVNMLNEGEQ